ncbi:hypothetical protein IE81DRAFT_323638 [Ceraceosorus guamensis]|uniref:Thiamine-binding protein domain-containing protein n=1 Tax=Ceraceosorus guamensis TaxID=1522189 RepID=A0A316W0Q8_9BASI|nr:hypothetical protein IE81DRAFT_323638 [Ceraceosorus guamensis]PWN42313.1 hypothetical protein IE81DRAFT_323638 [Ceraceosorus guamensis]
MGTPGTSVGPYIAECQRVLEKLVKRGDLTTYEVRGYGTNLEGTFSQVSAAIEQCHEAVHAKGAPRIATDIRIGTRTDKPAPTKGAPEQLTSDEQGKKEDWTAGLGENERKRESVRRILAGDA